MLHTKTKGQPFPLADYEKKQGADIHEQLAETIAERKRIIEQYRLQLAEDASLAFGDIHAQLQQTIRELTKSIHVTTRYGITRCIHAAA